MWLSVSNKYWLVHKFGRFLRAFSINRLRHCTESYGSDVNLGDSKFYDAVHTMTNIVVSSPVDKPQDKNIKMPKSPKALDNRNNILPWQM